MFGTNNLSKAIVSNGQRLDVQSIFYTIQGEGPFAGQPAIFIRLAGCNLRCHFCDTDFESKRRSMHIYDIDHEIEHLEGNSVKRPTLVVVTGGEPLLQNVVPLTKLLASKRYHVQFETAGTVWVEGLEYYLPMEASLVCSPKAGKVHPMVELHCRNWKYLIREGEASTVDGLPTKSTQIMDKDQLLFRPARKTDTIWLQPCEEYNVLVKDKRPFKFVPDKENLEMSDQEVTSAVRNEDASQRNIRLCAELAMKYNYRISLQLHKLLHLP